MNIKEIDYCPDSTYWRTNDVSPEIKEDGLHIYSGKGSRRGWGTPGNNSYIIYNDDHLTSIFIGFYHKHGGGQFWRHYVNGQQKTWAQLAEADQSAILESFESKAPDFARVPGLLKSKKAKQLTKIERENCIGYKSLIASYDGTNIVNLQSPSRKTEWKLDENYQWTLEADKLPAEDNKHGIYITFNAPVARSYSGVLCKVMLSGTIVVGEHGARGQFARVLEII